MNDFFAGRNCGVRFGPAGPTVTLLLAAGTILFAAARTADAQQGELRQRIDREANSLAPQLVEWRRFFYQNPELSNREFNTAKRIAEFLSDLGLDVQTRVAHTGVVGLLDTGRPGPVIALRADMDALPVPDRSGLPFASTALGEYRGAQVPVMHACGHDTHMAMLMGAAQILTGMRDQLHGKIKFIFQPAEEGPPEGEEGGADLMIREGVLRDPPVDVIFGMHIWSGVPTGQIAYRSGGIMAAADQFTIKVQGVQTHGSTPWTGVDPIVAASHIVTSLQTIVSRRTELTKNAAVVSVGVIEGGVRNNIIPEEVTLIGTIRTLDEDMRQKVHDEIRLTASKTAEAMGAVADVEIFGGIPVTYNDPELTERMLPSLRAAAGEENVVHVDAVTVAEDFSFFQRKVPGVYVLLGGLPDGMSTQAAVPHHTPEFMINEDALELGVRTHAYFVIGYLMGH
jgi:amidohydrolase